eukprot:SAG11_NODE_3102_length_2690_cov_2.208800_1_plen_65_part_00
MSCAPRSEEPEPHTLAGDILNEQVAQATQLVAGAATLKGQEMAQARQRCDLARQLLLPVSAAGR